jgi:hypothetical protein
LGRTAIIVVTILSSLHLANAQTDDWKEIYIKTIAKWRGCSETAFVEFWALKEVDPSTAIEQSFQSCATEEQAIYLVVSENPSLSDDFKYQFPIILRLKQKEYLIDMISPSKQ